MILERPFDQLMENIGGKKLMDVGAREIVGEWLLERVLNEWAHKEI